MVYPLIDVDMRKKHIYWKGWIWIVIILTSLLLLLNFVLPLQSFFPVIGDEKVWLTIWGNIISSVIATSVGVVMQRNYSRREYVKEQKLISLRNKVDNYKVLYKELKGIVESNISILEFNEFIKLIQYIDYKTANAELIAKVYDYQSSVLNVLKKIEFFFQNKEKSAEYIVYHGVVNEFVNIYNKILPAYIKYLNTMDKSAHKSFANVDILLPLVEEKDKLQLSMLKMAGNNMIYEWKDKFIHVFDTQKDNMDKLTKALNCASTDLLNDENEKIKELEDEIRNLEY
jgi:hypothetical protein|nr:MAG TPA: hypothetical protein [Caudoviricetes sp.]